MWYMPNCPTMELDGERPRCMSGKSRSWSGAGCWSFKSKDMIMIMQCIHSFHVKDAVKVVVIAAVVASVVA
jgi:hypothetical protein